MRRGNIEDDALLAAFRRLVGPKYPRVEFVPGFDGGVAIYRGAGFVGIWMEYRRGRYDFVPAGRSDTTICNCTIDMATVATMAVLGATDGNVHTT